MLAGNSDPRAYLALGFVAGTIAFFKCFVAYRKYRFIEDTPRIPIADAAIGVVRVRGTTESNETLLSPVSRTPCCYYSVDIQRWKDLEAASLQGNKMPLTNDGGQFVKWRTDSNGPRFYISDESGKMLVDLHGAELDFEQTGERILDGSSDSITATMADLDDAVSGRPPQPFVPPSERELQEYVSMSGVRSFPEWMNAHLDRSEPHSDPAKERTRRALLDLLRESGEADVTSAEARLDKMHKLIEARAAKGDRNAGQILQAYQDHKLELAATAARENTLLAGEGKYKLIERCVVANSVYEVVGTCMENSDAKESRDRVVIAKGKEESTFVISQETGEALESDLRSRATMLVFGGGALAVLCLVLFLYLSHL